VGRVLDRERREEEEEDGDGEEVVYIRCVAF
jgi:hypothetical protein